MYDAVCMRWHYNGRNYIFTKKGFPVKLRGLPMNERVKKYLLGRGIAGEIIEYCIAQRLLYEESRYHNAVFIGYDGENPKYAAIRGTNTKRRFLAESGGSNKAFCYAKERTN